MRVTALGLQKRDALSWSGISMWLLHEGVLTLFRRGQAPEQVVLPKAIIGIVDDSDRKQQLSPRSQELQAKYERRREEANAAAASQVMQPKRVQLPTTERSPFERKPVQRGDRR